MKKLRYSTKKVLAFVLGLVFVLATLPPLPALALQRGNDAFLELETLQPLGTQFEIREILEWTPEGNPDSRFNRSRVPRAPRRTGYVLNPFANPDALMVFSGDAYPIGGTASHSYGTVGAWRRYAVNFWQYIDIYNFWGGPVNIPTPELIDAAHRNGVPVVGTVFFANENIVGQQRAMYFNQGTDSEPYFPFADKLWEIAYFYGFDGWFFNFESTGTTNTTNANGRVNANEIAAFLAYMQDTKPHPDMILTQYDSPTFHNTWTNLADAPNEGQRITDMGLDNARGTFMSRLVPGNLYKIQQNIGTSESPVWQDTADFMFGDYKWTSRTFVTRTIDTVTHPLINADPYRFTWSWPLHMEGYRAIGPGGTVDRLNGLMSQAPWIRHCEVTAAQMGNPALLHRATASLGIFGGHAPINASANVGDFLNIHDARLWSGYRGLAHGNSMPHDPTVGFIGQTWNPDNQNSRGLNPATTGTSVASYESGIYYNGVEFNNIVPERAEAWHGFSQFLADRTIILDFPFVTHFNPGIGHDFFVDGVSVGMGDWSNRGIQCILPTWRWTVIREGETRNHPSLPDGVAAGTGTADIAGTGNPDNWEVTPSFDTTRAWWGGASLRLEGNATARNEVRLYSTFLPFAAGVDYQLELITTSSNPNTVRAGFYTAENYSAHIIPGAAWNTQSLGNGWYSHTQSINELRPATGTRDIYGLGLFVDAGVVDVNIGRIHVGPANRPAPLAAPENLTLDGHLAQNATRAEARIYWDAVRENRPGYNDMFEIWQVYEDGSRRFLNATFADAFFLSNIDRDPDSSRITLAVNSVDPHLTRSESTYLSFEFGMDPEETVVVPRPYNPNLLEGLGTVFGRLRWSAQNDSEPARALFDGDRVQSKWCVEEQATNAAGSPVPVDSDFRMFRTGTFERNARHWVVFDTGEPITVQRWAVYHAGAIESLSFNTPNFAIKYIPYGEAWYGDDSNRPPMPWPRASGMPARPGSLEEIIQNIQVSPGPWERDGDGTSIDIWRNVYAQNWVEADRVTENPMTPLGNVTDRDLNAPITARFWKFYVDTHMWVTGSNALRVFELEMYRHPKVGEFMPVTDTINLDQVRVVREGGALLSDELAALEGITVERYDRVSFRNLPNIMYGTRVNLYRDRFDDEPFAYSHGDWAYQTFWNVPGEVSIFQRTASFDLLLDPGGGRIYFDVQYADFARSDRIAINYPAIGAMRTTPPTLDEMDTNFTRFGINFNSGVAHVRQGVGEATFRESDGAVRLWANANNAPTPNLANPGGNLIQSSPWFINRPIFHGALELTLPEGYRFFIYRNEDDIFPARMSAPVAEEFTWTRIDALEFNNTGGYFWLAVQAPGMPESIRIQVNYSNTGALYLSAEQQSCILRELLLIRYQQVRAEFPEQREEEFTPASWAALQSALADVRFHIDYGFGHQPEDDFGNVMIGLDNALAGLERVAGHTLTFNLYTNQALIIDTFEEYATVSDDGMLYIEVPVIPGVERTGWPDQELLAAALGIGNIYGTTARHGYAFWGWVDDEMLDDSGRIRNGLRRPALVVDGEGICLLADLLAQIENGTEEALALFEDDNIDLYGVWVRWGDVDDNGILNMTDLGRLQQHINFGHIMRVEFSGAAADVEVDGVVNMTDLSLLQRHTNVGHIMPVVLGAKPQP